MNISQAVYSSVKVSETTRGKLAGKSGQNKITGPASYLYGGR